MENAACVVFREEASRFREAGGIIGHINCGGKARLLWQTHRRERTLGAQVLVVCHRRTFQGKRQFPRTGHGTPQPLKGRIVHGHAHRLVASVIAYAPFGNRPAEVFGKEHCIGRHLEFVAIPSVVALGTALLVLDSDESPIAVASKIHLATNAPFLAGKLQTLPFAILIYLRVMQSAPGVDAVVGNANFFDLFQVEKTLAVSKRM